MEKENLRFVIVGHVDHGKSTLIGRLFYDTDSLPEGKIEEIKQICESLGKDIEFGYVMDHLAEERDQGVTIDTAQTFFRTDKREYTIIDAPGHVEFIKNMITGASQAEAAILIVDANEGVKEQTRRHSYILKMLGLKQVIVTINKMDLVDYSKDRFNEVKKELIEFLDKLNIKPSYIIPISAKEGDFIAKKTENLKWFDGPTVLDALDSFSKEESLIDRPTRFAVQDVYKFDERINAGMVLSGLIKENDEILVLPSKETTKVKEIKEWLKAPKEAEAGKSIGIVTEDGLFLDRGCILTHKDEEQPKITSAVKGHLFWLDREPYKKGERVLFKLSSQEIMGELEKIERVIDSSTLETLREDADEIKNREVADVIIKLSSDVVFEDFNDIPTLGRFVLERQDTCAGGIITEIGGKTNVI
ncbi:MAG: GTP-binding protein [Candidatus Woesearchaeota archaeon]|nr:MAG: GTP-binding protein [Candidatus Woesearchaeota archaeon]